MARPLPRRRGERSAPDAGEYTSSRGRSRDAEPAEDDEPAEERRPRRGRERGELPARGGRSRAAEPVEEEKPVRRRRAAAPEPDPEPDEPTIELPATKRALDRLSEPDYEALCEQVGVDPDDDPEDVWDAIEEAREALEEDEPEEEPAPRRGRRSAPAEEEKPARRGRRAARDEEPEEEEEEDDAPRRKRTATGSRAGFAAFKSTRERTQKFDDDLKLTEDELLVKFLDDEPYISYAEHGLYKELSEGQRVWNCLESAPDDTADDCGVCGTGHNPRAIGLFNVVVIPEDGEPAVRTLKAGPLLMKAIEAKSKLKTGPMSKEYYSLSQTPSKNDGPPIISVEVVRERDLTDPDGWDTEPLTKAELVAFRKDMKDEDDVKFPSKAELKAVARKLRDRD